MFDAAGRKRGGGIAYYESEDAFADMVGRVLELGITEIGLYWPTLPEQRPMFERIATGVIPKLKAAHASSGARSQGGSSPSLSRPRATRRSRCTPPRSRG